MTRIHTESIMTFRTAYLFFMRNLVRTTPYLLSAILLLYFFSQPAETQTTDSDTSRIIESLLANQQHPLLTQPDFSRHRDAVIKLYRLNANQLIWLGEGRSEKNLNDVLAILNDAAADGLNPLNYDAEPLRGYIKQAVALPATAIKERASYDLALTIGLIRFAHDLHSGRIDPRRLDYPAQFGTTPTLDAVETLKQLLDQQRLTDLLQTLAPKIKQYQQLKLALANYRQQQPTTPQTTLSIAKSLRPGEQHPQIPELRKRLRELGELKADEPAGVAESDPTYDSTTEAAITRVQQQQGLNADGVIGKQTVALLNQSTAEKIKLIELAMERLRWLPDQPDGPLILVNIPAFHLWAFKSPQEENPLNMKVIVGKADKNQTPMLWEEMKYLEFMPFWNIPKSIMDQEIMPKMLSDETFLDNQNIELIERSADTNDENDAEDVIDDIKHGRIRARQRPGSKNPLGKVKFIFPNKADVYLHDTPGHNAFNRDRRDLSHGCVRVAEAEKLAEFVLDEQQGWDKESIQKAMAGPNTQRVSLKKAIPVLFFYSTAFVDQDNKIRFYPDIYRQDPLLQNAINKSAITDNSRLMISKNSVTGD